MGCEMMTKEERHKKLDEVLALVKTAEPETAQRALALLGLTSVTMTIYLPRHIQDEMIARAFQGFPPQIADVYAELIADAAGVENAN